jgi:hypothetical protein
MNRKQAQTFLWERARLRLEHLSEHAQERIRRARAENSQPSEGAVPVALRPEDIHIAVVGGPGQKSTYLPTWGGGTRAITRLVES